MNKEIFLSYLAGMFDNCGKLSLKKDGRTKKSIYPEVILRSKKEDFLIRVKEAYGGTLRKNKNSYVLILTHKKAKNLLNDLKDFSILKRREIEIIQQIFSKQFSGKLEEKRRKKLIEEFLSLVQPSERKSKNKKWSVKSLLED